jgi:3D-(3,5/4)-trihydroxycyclohexane-1,2-dione acylhydrolase (decyclizing)
MPTYDEVMTFDYPDALFAKRVWHVARPRPDAAAHPAAARALKRRC